MSAGPAHLRKSGGALRPSMGRAAVGSGANRREGAEDGFAFSEEEEEEEGDEAQHSEVQRLLQDESKPVAAFGENSGSLDQK